MDSYFIANIRPVETPGTGFLRMRNKEQGTGSK